LRGKLCGNGDCERRRGPLDSIGCVAKGRGMMERPGEGRSDEGKGKSEGELQSERKRVERLV